MSATVVARLVVTTSEILAVTDPGRRAYWLVWAEEYRSRRRGWSPRT